MTIENAFSIDLIISPIYKLLPFFLGLGVPLNEMKLEQTCYLSLVRVSLFLQVKDATMSNYGRRSQTVLTAYRLLLSSMRKSSVVMEVRLSVFVKYIWRQGWGRGGAKQVPLNNLINNFDNLSCWRERNLNMLVLYQLSWQSLYYVNISVHLAPTPKVLWQPKVNFLFLVFLFCRAFTRLAVYGTDQTHHETNWCSRNR